MAKQLKLPGIEEPDEYIIQLPQWIESNHIVFGQPFIIWGKPEHKDDPQELKKTAKDIFDTWEHIKHAVPWCSAKYTTDPQTGTPIIVAVPHRSGNEMIGACVSQALTTVTNYLATSFSVINMPTASFQLNSKISDSRKNAREEIEPASSQR